MDAKLKALWIDALLSGDYQQGKQRLRNPDNTYCCLGVLCDVIHKETGEGEWSLSSDIIDKGYVFSTDPNITFHQYGAWADSSVTQLPRKIRSIAQLPVEGITMELVKMNDEGKTFSEIAKFIEEKL